MDIEWISVDEVIPYENNPRKNEASIDKVAASIKEFGFKQPIVIDKNGVIVVGHTRLEAAKRLGWEKVPCIRANDLTDEQARGYRLADNKTSEFSEWDYELLTDELDNIFDIDMADFGFDLSFDDEEPEVVEDDVPDVPEEPKAVLGDLYEMGGHRLICGDSTDITVIDRLMDGNKADMVFTDPPYNVAMSRSKVDGSNNSIINDDLEDANYIELLQDAVTNVITHLKTNTMYWWIGFREYSTLEKILKDNQIKIANCIVWDKGSIGLGGNGYRFQHELCIFSGETNNNKASDVWAFKRSTEGIHPTMKPIELIAHAIKNIDNVDTVLDVFGGSGSTLIACEQLNRKCYMCELDPHYVDVIVQRYINLKGSDDDVFLIRDGKKIPYKDVI